ncbi:unnamed protein product [Rotaria magnacalcarata]|uniref:Nuclear receptor domain-containing protein n=2 Tax=Rotaria magnacalcarata TaxID=392030 RepID=A0A816WUU4_9BILA|nr:unnamed protein product [Rotaria magnacalcarata]CAF1974280.1 unnamed protein product [Rotaria magnacalcarata]CAF2138706.1 unnamed protein product [Rotaria magnacalcarata]CAF2215010.1 unnamed protein product [Rotaria magnacalcarata]CAF3919395.1 unnamed protein product [Rotaria magnacalcarata]
MNFEFRAKPGRKKTRKDDVKCLVCEGKAIGFNFGVPSCSPCKVFFRRNVVKLGTYEFRCRSDGHCSITHDTRRQCNCCRLAKCFRVGMNAKAIRTDDHQQLERTRSIESNQHKQEEKSNGNKQELQIISKQELIRPSESFMHFCPYSPILSSNDNIILTNIFHTYERTCKLFTYKEHLSMPVDETLTLPKFMNASANIYMALIYYLKSIPDFNSLPVNSKMSLIKSNLNQIVRLHSSYIMKTVTPDLDTDSPVFLHVFPEDLYIDIRANGIAVSPFVHDPILIRLFIVVLMLSTHMNVRYEKNLINHCNESSNRNILIVQNVYVELLWRYICSRCSNYQNCVKLFSSFIATTLCSQIVEVKIDKFIRTTLPSQNHQLEPIMKSMWEPEK